MKISLAKEPLLTVFTWYCSNCLITFGYFNVLTKTQFQMCNFKNYFTLLCMSITAKEMNSGQKLIMTVITFAPNWWRKNSLSKTKIESADNNEHRGRRSLRGTGGRLTHAPYFGKDKSPEVPFHGTTSPSSYFEVIWIFEPILKKAKHDQEKISTEQK